MLSPKKKGVRNEGIYNDIASRLNVVLSSTHPTIEPPVVQFERSFVSKLHLHLELVPHKLLEIIVASEKTRRKFLV